jgi:hypothetical protein
LGELVLGLVLLHDGTFLGESLQLGRAAVEGVLLSLKLVEGGLELGFGRLQLILASAGLGLTRYGLGFGALGLLG